MKLRRSAGGKKKDLEQKCGQINPRKGEKERKRGERGERGEKELGPGSPHPQPRTAATGGSPES